MIFLLLPPIFCVVSFIYYYLGSDLKPHRYGIPSILLVCCFCCQDKESTQVYYSIIITIVILATFVAYDAIMPDKMTPHIVKEDVHGYKDVNDLPSISSHVIPKGTICDLGEAVYVGKIDGFVIARCPAWDGFVSLQDSKNNFESMGD